MNEPTAMNDPHLDPEPIRSGPPLVRATKCYSAEDPRRTWMEFLSSILAVVVLIALATSSAPLLFRLAGSAMIALMIVRFFIFFHDAMHRALFRNSTFGRALMYFFGLLVLSPPRVWRDSHNYHHSHTSKLVGSDIGSFPIMTVDMYHALPWRARFVYRAKRHPLNIVFGYLTIFFFGMCLHNSIVRPLKYWDAPLSIVAHLATIAAVTLVFGGEVALLVIVLPMFIGCAIGSYLFYAQHTFPGMEIYERREWEYTAAALRSSSMMQMSRLMHWFTGNIGYHHVHHLNPTIPFYRLPEAMAGVKELQDPIVTTLRPKDVLACLRIHLWDPTRGEMIGFGHR